MRSGPTFRFRALTIPPGGHCPIPADGWDEEWDEALVVLTRGAVELAGVTGHRESLTAGAMLWLSGLPVRAIHNDGQIPAVLVGVSRNIGADR